MNSKIDDLLSKILTAVRGKDVRQYIHDAIKECYFDTKNGATLAETAAKLATVEAENAERRTSEAIANLQAEMNQAISRCNSATSEAIAVASKFRTKIAALDQKTNNT